MCFLNMMQASHDAGFTTMWLCANSFGSFDAADGYGGHVPGSQYMADICKTSARGTAATGYYNRMMCGIKGTTMCADHCHKPSKRIRQNGERASGAFWTCANAQVQILGQYAVRSKSLAEIKVPLTRMHSRLVKLQGTVRVVLFVCLCVHNLEAC